MPEITDWEAHYQSGDMPWEKGAPSPALLEALARIRVRGRVLVPGCGTGHDVRALSAAGAEVIGIDIAPSAIATARAFPAVGNERYELVDLFALPEGMRASFDWVVEHTCYCALPPGRRSDYVRAVAGTLKPCGEFLGVFYLDPGQPFASEGPPFETTLAELERRFSPHFELVEEWLPPRAYPGREGREWLRRYRAI